MLNTEAIVEIDITAVDALEALRDELDRRGVVFALARVKQDLLDELEPSGLLERVGREHCTRRCQLRSKHSAPGVAKTSDGGRPGAGRHLPDWLSGEAFILA